MASIYSAFQGRDSNKQAWLRAAKTRLTETKLSDYDNRCDYTGRMRTTMLSELMFALNNGHLPEDTTLIPAIAKSWGVPARFVEAAIVGFFMIAHGPGINTGMEANRWIVDLLSVMVVDHNYDGVSAEYWFDSADALDNSMGIMQGNKIPSRDAFMELAQTLTTIDANDQRFLALGFLTGLTRIGQKMIQRTTQAIKRVGPEATNKMRQAAHDVHLAETLATKPKKTGSAN